MFIDAPAEAVGEGETDGLTVGEAVGVGIGVVVALGVTVGTGVGTGTLAFCMYKKYPTAPKATRTKRINNGTNMDDFFCSTIMGGAELDEACGSGVGEGVGVGVATGLGVGLGVVGV